MSIKFKARVLLELGAELISSDAVAIYELVKNAVDAKSKSVTLSIDIIMQPSVYRAVRERWSSASISPWNAGAFVQDALASVDIDADEEARSAFADALGSPTSRAQALARLDDAVFAGNCIRVIDSGHGMTKAQLEECYLTVGTPHRRLERDKASAKGGDVPLGEKGIGRLAAMRLGHHVTVLTGVVGAKHRHRLELDWRPLFLDVDLDAGALSFVPQLDAKKDAATSGTTIEIRHLQSDWTEIKLRDLANAEFAKMRDPFKSKYAAQFLKFFWQGEAKQFGLVFPSHLLEGYDAKCSVSYRVGTGRLSDGPQGPLLRVELNHRLGASEVPVHSGPHLGSLVSHAATGKRKPKANDKLPGSDEVIAALATLGDFDGTLYWFNRGRIQREEPERWTPLKPFIDAWHGGFLVYRDGYRVYPYGSMSDDWLGLDRRALSAGGYKLNRAQLIGVLRISSLENPRLQDQTNREGFRDCPEKEALERMLRQAIITDWRTFIEATEDRARPADDQTIKQIERRIDLNRKSATTNLKQLRRSVPDAAQTINKVLLELKEVEEAWERAKEALHAHEAEIERYIHLAGVGLMVELIAHELARVTGSALEILAKKSAVKDPKQLAVLEAELKTLNRRVRLLDELSVPGRQVRMIHDIAEIADLIAGMYRTKGDQSGVQIQVTRVGSKKLKAKVERGQVLQILDNLLNNAIFWLTRRVDRSAPAVIKITVDSDQRAIEVVDNGPGVPKDNAQRIFAPFYTTKPGGEGRGLGLYIARRLAEENNASLDVTALKDGAYHGFRLQLGDA